MAMIKMYKDKAGMPAHGLKQWALGVSSMQYM